MQLKRKTEGGASLSVSVIKLGTKLERLCGFLFVVFTSVFYLYFFFHRCVKPFTPAKNNLTNIYFNNVHVSLKKKKKKGGRVLACRNSLGICLYIAPLCGQTKKFTGVEEPKCFIFSVVPARTQQILMPFSELHFSSGLSCTSCDVREILWNSNEFQNPRS